LLKEGMLFVFYLTLYFDPALIEANASLFHIFSLF